MTVETTHTAESIMQLLRTVPDPEIPVIDVVNMGIVREVVQQDDRWIVKITPTYTGCPAMHQIEKDIQHLLDKEGIPASVETVLAPAWTTDWLTDEARENLREYGIAPPERGSLDKTSLLGKEKVVPCPRCKSKDTQMISQFGSTACKALYQCNECQEPFDYFKCI